MDTYYQLILGRVCSVDALVPCVEQVKQWMLSGFLQLFDEKILEVPNENIYQGVDSFAH